MLNQGERMKAVVLTGLNEMQYKDIASDPKGILQRVDIQAAALNHRDVWIAKGQYAGIKYPMVLGSDGCGTTQEGAAVLLNPGTNWGADVMVQSKSYEILGLPNFGTFSEVCYVSPQQIVRKPPHLSVIEAAALPLAGVTAYRALFRRAGIEKKDRVLISGVGGGVALFALQFAVAAGAEVHVTSGTDFKIERALAMGATSGKNYKDSNWAKAFQSEIGGFDLIVDSAAGEGFSNLVKLANPGGRIVFYGGGTGNITLNPQIVFWKQLSIYGSTMGNDMDFAEMLQFVELHRIVPVVDDVFEMKDFRFAFEKMQAGQQFGKIVLVNP